MNEAGGEPAAVAPRLLLDPGHFLALGAGTGLAPWAPGTFGTLAGLALYFPLAAQGGAAYAAACAALFLLGIPLCARTARRLGMHDHGAIVFDEVVGYLLAVAYCSSGFAGLAVGFCAFRFFDIVKPWPVKAADKYVGGGLGIMLDDVLAGGYALLVVEIFEYFSFGYRIFQ